MFQGSVLGEIQTKEMRAFVTCEWTLVLLLFIILWCSEWSWMEWGGMGDGGRNWRFFHNHRLTSLHVVKYKGSGSKYSYFFIGLFQSGMQQDGIKDGGQNSDSF